MPSSSIALVLFASELDREHAAYGAVQNFVDVYEDGVDRIAIVGPERIDIDRPVVDRIPIGRPETGGPASTIVEYLGTQMRIAAALWRERERIDAAFFHIGGSMLLVPLLANKLAAVRTLIFVTGTVTESVSAQRDPGPVTEGVTRAVAAAEGVTCTLADDLILLSSGMDHPAPEWPLSPTIRAVNFNYVDCETFAKRTAIEERSVDIAFVGRFETVKGVDAIRRAIPPLVESNPNIRIELIGDGKLRDEIETFVDRRGFAENVTFTGWIDHDELPARLDDARTLLLPSRSEGVPKALLEAMACGTVPIATPVGGVPDIVDDGSNGFLLPDAESGSIERTVTTALERDDLDEISDAARDYIDRHYAYGPIKERCRRLLRAPDGR